MDDLYQVDEKGLVAIVADEAAARRMALDVALRTCVPCGGNSQTVLAIAKDYLEFLMGRVPPDA